MNFDNILFHIKLNSEKKYVSLNIEHYNGNIELIKKDMEKYSLKQKTVVICVENEHALERILKYIDNVSILKIRDENIVPGKINILVKPIESGFVLGDIVVISSADLFRMKEGKKKFKNKFK